MNQIINVMDKELRHIFRDVSTVIMCLSIPVLIVTLFGFAISTDLRHIDLATYVPSPSQQTREFLSPIIHNPYFHFQGEVSSVESGIDLMRTSKISALVVLRPDFDNLFHKKTRNEVINSSAVEILVDASDCAMSESVKLYIMSALSKSSRSHNIQTRMLFNPRLLSAYTMEPGIIAIAIVFICIVISSSALVSEREFGSIDYFTTAPISSFELMLGKFLPYLFLGIIATILSLAIGNIMHEVPIRGSIVGIALLSLAFTITSLLIGLFISTISKTQANAYMYSFFFISLPMMYFGGIIIPAENLPWWGKPISDLLYVKWYVAAMRKLMIQGVDFIYVLKEFIIILVTAVVLFFTCVYRLRNGRWLR